MQLAKKLFEVFGDYLEEANLITHKGKLLDASFINAPIQGNTKAKNKTVKAGDIPENWQNDSNKLRQKDLDATWTKKGKQSYYAYKTHIKVDKVSKLIIKGEVSTASVHDSQLLESLLDNSDSDQSLWADSDYIGQDQEKALDNDHIINQVIRGLSLKSIGL